jgi:hypothetical protein
MKSITLWTLESFWEMARGEETHADGSFLRESTDVGGDETQTHDVGDRIDEEN